MLFRWVKPARNLSIYECYSRKEELQWYEKDEIYAYEQILQEAQLKIEAEINIPL